MKKLSKKLLKVAKKILKNKEFKDIIDIFERDYDTRKCFRCNGKGTIDSILNDGKDNAICPICNGNQVFKKPNIEEVIASITCAQGKHTGGIREAYAASNDPGYYVWRYTKYYLGIDHFKPVLADVYFGFHPYQEHLNLLAKACSQYFRP